MSDVLKSTIKSYGEEPLYALLAHDPSAPDGDAGDVAAAQPERAESRNRFR